jgi:phosphatidate cytidylyltransferase
VTGSNTTSSSDGRNLALRIASSLTLAPLAIVSAYFGGWAFAAFWAVGAVAVWWEWVHIMLPRDHLVPFITGASVLVLATGLTATEHEQLALLITALGALAVTVLANHRPAWLAGGIVYSGALLLGSMTVRNEIETGFMAVIFLFAVVWSADIAGYFVGRAFGGPKLAPSISPGKTWSGALGGFAASIVAALCVAYFFGSQEFLRAAVLGGLISVVAQSGDLFESKVKRKFDVKDSGALIPGHGGVMDRIDGYIAAAAALALLHVGHGFVSEAPARFLVW